MDHGREAGGAFMITKEQIERLMDESGFFKPETNHITLHTGRGGVKEFIKAWCHEIGVEYNWRNFRRQYTAMRKAGWITPYRWKS